MSFSFAFSSLPTNRCKHGKNDLNFCSFIFGGSIHETERETHPAAAGVGGAGNEGDVAADDKGGEEEVEEEEDARDVVIVGIDRA